MEHINISTIEEQVPPFTDCKKVKTTFGAMWISPHDKVIGNSLERLGMFEEQSVYDVVKFLKKYFRFKPHTFIDIGANIGTHLIYALKKINFKKAIGFEPEPFNFSLLKLNIECNGIVDKSKIYNIAISDKSGDSRLALSENNFGDHRISINNDSEITETEIVGRKKVSIKTERFDRFLGQFNINADSNTLVWIDTQGHEGHVVSGFNYISSNSQPFVVLEFWPYGLEKSGGKDKLMDFLRNCKYVYDIRGSLLKSFPINLSENDIEKIYKKFLLETTADYHPHTDFLCIPQGSKVNKMKMINPYNVPIIIKNKLKQSVLSFQVLFNINRINIQKFEKDPTLHVNENSVSPLLKSEVCRFERLNTLEFRNWIKNLNYEWIPHRKYWELAFICQALFERNMLHEGAKGLGFAVGTERLPALFASFGCNITATDLPSDDERNKPWAETSQWGGSLDALQNLKICSKEKFNQYVKYLPVDMNNIPGNLVDYDFTWSTCSFEHCGSLELGIKFIEEQMKCLKPGGIAVHTTEFNLTSNEDTIESPLLSIYRLQDIEKICRLLIQKGYHVEPIDTFTGNHKLDKYVDKPPYAVLDSFDPNKTKHLRLTLGRYVSTSIALIIKK